MANSVDPDETDYKSRLIRIYNVCKTLFLVCVERINNILMWGNTTLSVWP